jgi:hypothetical protein
LTTSKPSKPQHLTFLLAYIACYRDSFTLLSESYVQKNLKSLNKEQLGFMKKKNSKEKALSNFIIEILHVLSIKMHVGGRSPDLAEYLIA